MILAWSAAQKGSGCRNESPLGSKEPGMTVWPSSTVARVKFWICARRCGGMRAVNAKSVAGVWNVKLFPA
jgi:hypothetical protein